MPETKLKPVSILSILIAILATIASAGGLLLNGLYRDNAFVTCAGYLAHPPGFVR